MWIRFLFSTFTNCIPNKSGVILCHTIKYEHYKHLLVYLIVKHVFSAVSSVKTLPYRKLLKRYYDLHVYLNLFWFIKSPFFFNFLQSQFWYSCVWSANNYQESQHCVSFLLRTWSQSTELSKNENIRQW